MKILVTGGAGFIGSNYTDRVLSKGYEVLVIDNYATSGKNNLVPQKNLKIVEGTVADSDLMATLFDEFRPDFVVHAAASYKDPDNWGEDIRTNIDGAVNVIRGAERVGIKRLIYLQTALCYGTPVKSPIPIDHPIGPKTSYSITKTTAERFFLLSDLPVVSLRLANVYGPRHCSGPIPTFYKRLKEGKSCFVVDTRRDFVEMEDLFGLMDAVLEGKGENGCYNVSTGRDASIKEIFDIIANYLNPGGANAVDVLPPGPDDVNTLLLDPSKTEETFNWYARVPLKEGIIQLLEWYDLYGINETYTHLKIGPKS